MPRVNPFHAGSPDKRQPALNGDLGSIAESSIRDKLIDQGLADDAQLFGEYRLDRRVICTAVDRYYFKGMIDKRLDVGLDGDGKLLCEG